MKDDSYDHEAWQERIGREDVSDIERAKFQIMDEYMHSRENLPGQSAAGAELKEFPQSTAEIQDDMRPMAEIAADDIILYMTMHGFHLTTLDDGTVKWAIWRDMRPLM